MADATITKAIVKARKSGAKWKEIADEVELTVGRTIFLHECATAPEDEQIDPEGKPAVVSKAIVTMRDKQSMSWGQISARMGRGAMGEGRVRTIYAEAEGTIENVKRGGRYPKDKTRADIRPDLDDTSAKPAKGSKSAASKAASKKAPAKTGGNKIADMSAKEFVAHAKGQFITTTDGDKLEVKSIKHSNGMFEIVDADGEDWGLEMSDIKKVTKS